MFIDKGSLAIKRSFKTARVRVGAVKEVNKYNLRRWLIIYKLKCPLLLMYSLISASNYSIKLSSWATLYSTYSTDLLFLLKTHTLLYQSSYLSPTSTSLLASLNVYILKLLKSSQYNFYKLLSLKLHLIYLLILKLIQLVRFSAVVSLVRVILLPQRGRWIPVLDIMASVDWCLWLAKAVKRKGICWRLGRAVDVILTQRICEEGSRRCRGYRGCC